MTVTVLQVLQEIEAVLTPEEAFTQKAFARNSAGTCVNPESRDAVCFCLEGALHKVVTSHVGEGTDLHSKLFGNSLRLLEKSSVDLFNALPISVNDGQGHKAVLHVIQNAKKLAQPVEIKNVPETV